MNVYLITIKNGNKFEQAIASAIDERLVWDLLRKFYGVSLISNLEFSEVKLLCTLNDLSTCLVTIPPLPPA